MQVEFIVNIKIKCEQNQFCLYLYLAAVEAFNNRSDNVPPHQIFINPIGRQQFDDEKLCACTYSYTELLVSYPTFIPTQSHIDGNGCENEYNAYRIVWDSVRIANPALPPHFEAADFFWCYCMEEYLIYLRTTPNPVSIDIYVQTHCLSDKNFAIQPPPSLSIYCGKEGIGCVGIQPCVLPNSTKINPSPTVTYINKCKEHLKDAARSWALLKYNKYLDSGYSANREHQFPGHTDHVNLAYTSQHAGCLRPRRWLENFGIRWSVEAKFPPWLPRWKSNQNK